MFSNLEPRAGASSRASVSYVPTYKKSREIAQFETITALHHANLRLALLSGTFNPLLPILSCVTFIIVLYPERALLSHKSPRQLW